MPDINFYLSDEKYAKYKKLDIKIKKEINGKAREVLYKELDKIGAKPTK
jgi:hypothetical protein